ncbi:MAG: DUF559 domain-containing protein [Planctomycetota bacterium]|nr:MAG: DUF559 domain-containing protein [Planctomycetota bacterium]
MSIHGPRAISTTVPSCDLAVIGQHQCLAIEIDGRAHHATGRGRRSDDDHWRDLTLTHHGWRVIRFWAHEIQENCAACLAQVVQALEDE